MNIVWFRNDLRVQANPALLAAHKTNAKTVAVVCLVPHSWKEHHVSPKRMGLWRDRLKALGQELAELNVPLKIINAGHFKDCAVHLSEFAVSHQATDLFYNCEYPMDEQRRDRAVASMLSANVRIHSFHGDVVIPPGELKTQTGTDFKVYTPFSKAWKLRLQDFDEPIKAIDSPFPETIITPDQIPEDLCWQALDYDQERWPADTKAIRNRVYQFIQERELDYKDARDFPGIEGTSKLSPYLTIGAVSPVQLMHVQRIEREGKGWLESSWLNEIIWREFYRHLMVAFPNLSKLEPFRPETEAKIVWLERERHWQAWCQGETGFPIVDAAMKQMLETGWMHNRLRMVVASFLTKLLGIDWRRGEAFFMEHLIDGDFPSNNGGWQWSASVGADAAPYFRIFNPIAQSEKFDADGRFLIRWLPQLEALAPKERHKPGAGQVFGRPAPIIDYALERKRALESYKEAGES